MSKNVKTDHTHIIESSMNGCRLTLIARQNAVSLDLFLPNSCCHANVYKGDALHVFNAAVRAYVEHYVGHLDRTERTEAPPVCEMPCQTPPPANSSNAKSS